MHSQDFRPNRRRFSSLYRQAQIRVCRTHSSLPVSLMLWDKGPGSNSRPVGQAPNPQGYFYEQQMSPQQSQFQQEQQSSPMQEQQTQPRANERLNPLAYLSKNKPQDDEEIQPAAEEATAETEEESAPRKKKKREKNKKKKDKESAEMREQKRRKQFQSRANTDGYYTDRGTMDELEEFDGERRISVDPHDCWICRHHHFCGDPHPASVYYYVIPYLEGFAFCIGGSLYFIFRRRVYLP